MNLHNLFEDDSRTPNPNYAEELAYQIFKAAPNLDTTGAADEVLDYAFDLAVNDLGRKRAHSLFSYDEDFDSDLVNAYLDLQMNQQAVDKKQVNEVDPRNFDSDEDYYAAKNAPAKRRSAPSDYPYSPEEDDAYFREIFRKKREAAKKAEQDKDQGVAEGQDVDVGVVVSKLKKFVANAEQQLQNADYDQQRQYATTVRDRALKALNMIEQGGNTPEAASAAFKYMQSGEQGVAEELAMQHQRDHKTQKYADTSNSLAKRSISQAEVPNVSKSADGHPTVRGRADSTRKTTNTRVEPTITPTSVKRLGGGRPIPSFLQKNVAEANKKKDDDLGQEIKDVSLNRAITRAKADFPTAGSGIEALAKDFMRSQEQDQTAFGQLRQAERKQDQMLSQISKIDQEQEKEIQSLDNQNSSLASRLQQLQNVNSELEKKLAAMSGRKKEKRKDKSATAPEPSLSTAPATPATGSTTEPDNITPEPSASPVIGRMAQDLTAEPSKSKAIGQIARTLSPPSAAIDQMAQQLKPRQKELDFDNGPGTLKPKKFDTSRATDVVARDPREIAKDVKQNIQQYGSDLAGSRSDALRNLVAQDELPMENDDKEAKYGDKYQDMVARVGQKAREQEKSKPVDIKDLARRLAAIEASRKD